MGKQIFQGFAVTSANVIFGNIVSALQDAFPDAA